MDKLTAPQLVIIKEALYRATYSTLDSLEKIEVGTDTYNDNAHWLECFTELLENM